MIKVYPKYDPKHLDRSLITQHIFKDSKGKRHTLNPAEKMEDVGKVPQEFDGEDFAVATKIMNQLDAKTVTVSKDDRKILEATLKAGDGTSGEGETEKKSSKKDIKEAVAGALAEADEAHEAAMSKLQADHDKALAKASK